MRRVQRREMEVLFSIDEAAKGGSWPVAPRYHLLGDVIYPYVEFDDRITYFETPLWITARTPLTECNAFLSFARLAVHSEPSKHAILKWVHQYGLLRRLDAGSPKGVVLQEGMDGRGRHVLNQEPMSLEQFWTEARHAYDLLKLFETIRDGDLRALRKRMTVWTTKPSGTSAHGHTNVRDVVFGDLKLATIIGSDNAEVTDDWLLTFGRSVLEGAIELEIAEVRYTFGPDGKLAVSCPDLRTAMYWQFACLVGGKRPTDVCEGCGGIFTKRRRDQKCCNSTCRSRKSRTLRAK